MFATALTLLLAPVQTLDELPDLRSVAPDLELPPLTDGEPGPGRRVRLVAPEYANTGLSHLLYLPTDWSSDRRVPGIVEYAGNGPWRNAFGDECDGRPEGSKLGYGISGGEGSLWLCLPFVSESSTLQRQWWGDLEKTVEYCKTVVPQVCEHWGGDPRRVILAGFSRGAIACNLVGLHDDEIARLWCGFVCHSHYDGVRDWGRPWSDGAAAVERLRRLGSRPQWISHEGSVAETRKHLEQHAPEGRFALHPLPFRNHSDAWVLRDIPLRRELRRWLREVLDQVTPSDAGDR